MSAPTPREAWRDIRAKGIGVEAAERLRSGDPVEIAWWPPVKISDGPIPCDVQGYRFAFRLHRSSDGWWVEGTDTVSPWEPCEGPIVDSGRAPWLARPKDLGDQQ